MTIGKPHEIREPTKDEMLDRTVEGTEAPDDGQAHIFGNSTMNGRTYGSARNLMDLD